MYIYIHKYINTIICYTICGAINPASGNCESSSGFPGFPTRPQHVLLGRRLTEMFDQGHLPWRFQHSSTPCQDGCRLKNVDTPVLPACFMKVAWSIGWEEHQRWQTWEQLAIWEKLQGSLFVTISESRKLLASANCGACFRTSELQSDDTWRFHSDYSDYRHS